MLFFTSLSLAVIFVSSLPSFYSFIFLFFLLFFSLFSLFCSSFHVFLLIFFIAFTSLPEEREFWGWWLELAKTDEGFAAKYYAGQYDLSGNWQDIKIPAKVSPEVNRTQEVFHQKLIDTLQDRFGLKVILHKESAEFV